MQGRVTDACVRTQRHVEVTMTQNHKSSFPAVSTFLLGFLLALIVAPCLTAQIPARTIYGVWKIKRIIPTSNIQTSADAAKKYLGMEIVYSAEKFKFNGDAVEHPKYKTGKMTADTFYEEYRAQLKELGVTRGAVATVEVQEVKGEAVLSPGAIVFIRNSNTIVTMWDGIYFEVVRESPTAKPATTPKPAQ
jgi:hypothetical protein